MHSCDQQELQTRDSSTPSASSTEDLMASGVRGNNNKPNVATSHSDGSHHIYEDIDLKQAPPKLAPSGVYIKGKTVVRPIAFKPVLASSVLQHQCLGTQTPITVGSSPFSSIESSDTTSNAGNMNKNTTNTKSALSQSQYSLSQHSFFLEDDNWYSEIATLKLPETPGLLSNGQGSTYDLAAQTPSPSDSGIIELEAMLREKDSEISYLRETLEQNEQVIFKVYEEKEQAWQREFKKLRAIYETKLKASQQRLFKAEQTLQVQNQQSQGEKRKLLTELEEARRNNDASQNHVMRLQSELSSVQAQLEEMQWSLCQKSGEIALLKSQLKEIHGEQTSKFNELVSLRTQLRDAKNVVDQKSLTVIELEEKLQNPNFNSLESSSLYIESIGKLEAQISQLLRERDRKNDLKQENAKLQQMVESLKEELDNTKEEIEEEKVQWLEEKEKVIRYQKQLQSNYMQMYRRNKNLEYEIQQMSLLVHKNSLKETESQC